MLFILVHFCSISNIVLVVIIYIYNKTNNNFTWYFSCKKTDVDHLKATEDDEYCVIVEVEEKNKKTEPANNNCFGTHIIG